jgi:hypothetical protein
MNKPEVFKATIDDMYNTYVKKNKRYGDSVSRTFKEYGNVALMVRLDDKLNRARQILVKGVEATDSQEAASQRESVYDTLKDLAVYSIMAIMELQAAEEEKTQSMKVDSVEIKG